MEYFKVGDKVKITKGHDRWSPYMDHYIGQIAILKNEVSLGKFRIDLDNKCYIWSYTNGHFVKYAEPTKLSVFPKEGFVKSTHKTLLKYLSFRPTAKNETYEVIDKHIGIAWNESHYWGVFLKSSKPLYEYHQLEPFFKDVKLSIEEEDFQEGEVVTHHGKTATIVTKFKCGKEYAVINHDGSGWTCTDKFARQYGIPSKFVNEKLWRVSSESIKKLKTIKTSNKQEEHEHKSNKISRSIKVCKPNLKISEGVRTRGFGLKSSGSKIKLGNYSGNY
jgi:hypothetical protein